MNNDLSLLVKSVNTNYIIKSNISKSNNSNYLIFEAENNNFYLKQLVSNKYLNNDLKLNNSKYKFNKKDINSFLKKKKTKIVSTVTEFKDNLIKNFKNQKNYGEFLKNKRVVIVGPADYVSSLNINSLINNYDLIVRVNKGLKQQGKNNSGDRTDILYHVVNTHIENGGPLDLKFKGHLRFVHPILDLYENTSFKNIGTIRDFFQIFEDKKTFNHIKNNFSVVNKNKYIEMEKMLKSRPNGGVGAILDLLNFDIKELYITGFTLFQTNYCKNYRESVDGISGNTSELALKRMKKSSHHNQKNTALVFRDYILKNKKVKFDKILEECVLNLLK